VIGQPRSTQRYDATCKSDEQALRADIIRLATKYGRYGYRRILALLCSCGWHVNHKRMERIWRQEGLKVPKKQPKRGRLWLNDGSCVRLRPTHRNHVWSYDFVMDRTYYGRPIKILTLIDEYSRHCLALVVDRSIKSDDVLHIVKDIFDLERCWMRGDENNRWLFAAMGLAIQMHQLKAFKLGKSTWIIKEQVLG